jgi:hypothetical protein
MKINISFLVLKLPYFLAYKMHFFPQKSDLNLNWILYAEGSINFQTYKYSYIY